MKIEYNTGDVVKSLAGHDRDQIFALMSVVNDNYVMIIDGKRRKISNPKLKKVKHLQKISSCDILASEILNGSITDKKVLKALNQYKQ